MKNLPVEMIVKIMQYLYPKDIRKLSESSKYMHSLVKKNRKTHIYELPDKVLEKIFGYVVNTPCLEGLKNTRLQKYKKYTCLSYDDILRIMRGMGSYMRSGIYSQDYIW